VTERTPENPVSRKFEDLVALQARLLAPGGCPWDREQTHESLRTYLLEEAYEVLEALDSPDRRKLPEELGDLLLQIVFHAELARLAGRFEIGDVIESIYTKMVRRHPHVFGDQQAADAQAVLKNWEQLKAEERRANGQATENRPESLLDGVPRTLPAALEAYQLTRRASRIGFDWDQFDGLLEKLQEEVAELRKALASGDAARREEEAGDLLFVAVNIARFLRTDPEIALKKANRKFIARFQQMERAAAAQGRKLADVPREEMERLWDRAKAEEKVAAATRGEGS
jgi:MazG family protein